MLLSSQQTLQRHTQKHKPTHPWIHPLIHTSRHTEHNISSFPARRESEESASYIFNLYKEFFFWILNQSLYFFPPPPVDSKPKKRQSSRKFNFLPRTPPSQHSHEKNQIRSVKVSADKNSWGGGEG